MVKNTMKTVALIILTWIILPTGDPTDLIFIGPIINILGIQLYLILSTILVFYLYKTIEGKTLKDKFNNIKKEMGGLSWQGKKG